MSISIQQILTAIFSTSSFFFSRGNKYLKRTYNMFLSLKGVEVWFALPPQQIDGDDLVNIMDLWITTIYNSSYFFLPRNRESQWTSWTLHIMSHLTIKTSGAWTQNTGRKETVQPPAMPAFRCFWWASFSLATLQSLPQRFSLGTRPGIMMKEQSLCCI